MQGGRVVLAAQSVVAVTGHGEQGIVDADAEPDHGRDLRRTGRHVRRVGEQRDAAQTDGDGDRRQPDGHEGGHDRAERDDQHDERGHQAHRLRAGRLRLGVEEHRVAAQLGGDAGCARRLEGVGQRREWFRPSSSAPRP